MEDKKEKKRMSGGVKALLIIVVLLAVLLGLPYLYLSIGFPWHTQEAILASVPMSSDVRYTFHSENRTVDIAVDGMDAAWVIASRGGPAELIGENMDGLAALGLTVSKYGVDFEDGDLLLNARLLLKGFLPLPLQARLGVSAQGNTLVAQVKAIKLGRFITLDPENFPIDRELLSFSIDGGDIHSRLEQLQSLTITDEKMILTCSVGRELLGEILENVGQVRAYADYLGAFEAVQAADEIADDGAPGARFDALIHSCEMNPAHFVEFKRSELAIAEDFKASIYFTNGDSALLPRFLPEVTRESVDALSKEYDADMELRRGQLQTIVKKLQELNEGRWLAADGKQFLNLAMDSEPIHIYQLLGSQDCSVWLDPADTRVIWGYNASYYMTLGLDPVSRMPKVGASALAGLRTGEKYMPVLLMRTQCYDRPVLAFYVTGGTFTLLSVEESAYQELMESPSIPVYNLNVKDYK